ncbi:MAG: 2-hydroxyacyl-CoA dehydratase [Chloroflexi bacterium]|nr:2-hydroxyacyl-CoA dehydratase [Chloroflexota bacterium]
MAEEWRETKVVQTFLDVAYLGRFLLRAEPKNAADFWQMIGGMEGAVEVLPPEQGKLLQRIQPDVTELLLDSFNRPIAQAWCDKEVASWEHFIKQVNDGKFMLYHYFGFSSEIFAALDTACLCFELPGGQEGAYYMDGLDKAVDVIEAEGYPDHLCSAQKGTAGYLLQRTIPQPDAFVKSTAPCDPSNAMYEWAAHYFNKPLIVNYPPYYFNDRAFKFWVGEIKRMIKELERLTGNELKENKLREHCEYGNEALSYVFKLQELRKRTPCPDTGWHRPLDTMCGINFGFPWVVDYFKAVYEDVKQRADNGVGVIPEGKEEIRCTHGWAFLAYDLPWYSWLEKEHGATYMECGLTYFPPETGLVDTTNLETMIRGLAWKWFNMPMGRQSMSFADIWINDMIRISRDYKADVLLLAGHMACKHFWALNKLLSDAVRAELSIPCLRFEADIFDERFTTRSELKRICTEFFGTYRKPSK